MLVACLLRFLGGDVPPVEGHFNLWDCGMLEFGFELEFELNFELDFKLNFELHFEFYENSSNKWILILSPTLHR